MMEGEIDQMRTGGESKCSRRRSEAEELFICECGKTYLTFSALYLHVKLKHNMRLTNKKNENNHKTQEINNKKYTTYFLRESSNQPENLNYSQQNHNRVTPPPSPIPPSPNNQQKVHLYLAHLLPRTQRLCPPFHTYELVLTAFSDYLTQIEGLDTNDNNSRQEPLDLTFYFNEFSTYFVPIVKKGESIASVKHEQVVSVLFNLWKWLKSKGMSSVELVCCENAAKKDKR